MTKSQLSNVFISQTLGTVVFATDVQRMMLSFRQAAAAHESGGILLGTVLPNECVVVEEVTVPGAHDRSGHYFFDRAREPAQPRVEAAWSESQGERIYLGEWHTHPQPVPTPSARDRAMIRNMLKESQMQIDFLLLAVLGYDGAWLGEQRTSGLTRLRCDPNSATT